jgi:hypothetical protein
MTQEWDIFISHASEDRDGFVRPFAGELARRGLKVWFDGMALTLGSSLRRSIDDGIAGSRYAAVVISPRFLAKPWPRNELGGLFAREAAGHMVILPILHELTEADLLSHSPMLADRFAVSSGSGIAHVADRILEAIRDARASGATPRAPVSAAPKGTSKAFSGTYCSSCGAPAGGRSTCASDYSSHSFVKAAVVGMYCTHCGGPAGERSSCASGFGSHSFVEPASPRMHCTRCGSAAGERAYCVGGFSSHAFVAS